MESKIKTLLDMNIPFCIGVGDLFGTMDWFSMVQNKEHWQLRSWATWVRSDEYFDVWLMSLNSSEVIEFREKYQHLFYRNKHDGDGTVYEKKDSVTFQVIYKRRRRIRQREKERQEALRIKRMEKEKEERKKAKEVRKKKAKANKEKIIEKEKAKSIKGKLKLSKKKYDKESLTKRKN